MSNLEEFPVETRCASGSGREATPLILPQREVPLGGPRAMRVRRTLPSKERSLIGAWCFLDHYGPEDVSAVGGGMRVPPHPHIGLQTVSWLFSGEIEHRDSAGHQVLVRPGELQLMTAGRGINHSEYSTQQTTVLHGVQLWTALPDAARATEPTLESYVPPALHLDGGELRVFLGSLLGADSPIVTHTPLLGCELRIEAGATLRLPLELAYEHGVLADGGPLLADDTSVSAGDLAYLAPGRTGIELHNPGDALVRVMLLGGPPFEEEITMWWNFVGRRHEEIVEAREAWQEQLAGGSVTFGPIVGTNGGEDPLPAPGLPGVRLKPRGGARERRGT